MCRRRKLLVLLAVVCAVSVPAAAQTRPRFRFVTPIQQGGGGGGSTNPIDAARRPSTTTAVPDVVWSGAGVSGGIPSGAWTQCGSTVTAYTGTAGTINTAISNCTANHYVLLGSGTFNLSSGIDFNGKGSVVLRGSGANSTKIVFSGNVSCSGLAAGICFQGPVPDAGTPQHTATISAGYSKGSAAFTFSSTTSLAANVLVIVDQENDSDTDNGAIWTCSSADVCGQDTSAGATRSTTPQREQSQVMLVSSVVSSTVTMATPIYMPNWTAGHNPGAWWAGGVAIQNSGVEDLSVDYAASDPQSGILFIGAYNCWVRNVASYDPGRNHVWIFESGRITVRDSYFDESQNHASQSYGVEPFLSSDNLIENNIFHHITAPILVNGSASGSVMAYNYTFDNTYTPSATWMIAGGAHHSAGTEMILWEGNDLNGWQTDNVHGTHDLISAFRDYMRGFETGKNQQTSAIIANAFSRFMNFVGNVLGTPAFHTVYECAPTGATGSCASDADHAVFTIGWSGNEGAHDFGSTPNDTLTKSTMYRWGNYDIVNAATQWNSGEVPSGLSNYAQPVPSDHTLPNSLYLSAKPSWWPATIPWPAIGPDVTGGDITGLGGHAYKIPAHKCYENATKDGNGKITNYDFNACSYS